MYMLNFTFEVSDLHIMTLRIANSNHATTEAMLLLGIVYLGFCAIEKLAMFIKVTFHKLRK